MRIGSCIVYLPGLVFISLLLLFGCNQKKVNQSPALGNLPAPQLFGVTVSCGADCGDDVDFTLGANKTISSQVWDGPNGYSGGIITNLTDLDSGTYGVTVTDTDGCTATNEYILTVATCCAEMPGATCSFDGTALTLIPETSALTITSDVLEWRKVDPNNNATAFTSFQTYTGPLTGCDIKEEFDANWNGVAGCSESTALGGAFIFDFNTGITTCDPLAVADWQISFNGSITNDNGTADPGTKFETIASFQTNGPKTFQGTYTSPLGPLVAAGQYSYSGSGPPADCSDITWTETLVPNDLYYTIEWRRTTTSAECGVIVENGFCEIGDCVGKAINVVCDASNVTTTVTGCTVTNYDFLLNGSLVQSGASNTLASPQSGTYTVVATCSDGCVLTGSVVCSVPCNANATIVLNGTCDLIVSSLTGCTGTPVYQWYLDFIPISGATSASYTATANGTYNVRIDGCSGCATISSNSVNVTGCTDPCDNFNVNLNPSSNTYCSSDVQGFSVSISNGQAPYTYQWTLNGSVVGTGSTYFATLPVGSYTLFVSVIDGNSCVDSDSFTFSVVDCTDPCDNFNVIIAAGSRNQTICDDESQLFLFSVFSGTPPYSVQWTLNGANVSTSTTYTASGLSAGVYTVGVTVTDDNNCTDSFSTTLTVEVCCSGSPVFTAQGPPCQTFPENALPCGSFYDAFYSDLCDCSGTNNITLTSTETIVSWVISGESCVDYNVLSTTSNSVVISFAFAPPPNNLCDPLPCTTTTPPAPFIEGFAIVTATDDCGDTYELIIFNTTC